MGPHRRANGDQLVNPQPSPDPDQIPRPPTPGPYGGNPHTMSSSTTAGGDQDPFGVVPTDFPSLSDINSWRSILSNSPWRPYQPSTTLSTAISTPPADRVDSTGTAAASSALNTHAISSPSNTAMPNEQDGDDWGPPQGVSRGGMYAAAAITPILVLAIIAGAYFCMRKRKQKRRNIAAAQKRADEMKMQPRSPPTTRAYMAPPSSALPEYTARDDHLPPPPNPALTQPIILGPIPSGDDGAYFTGMDTSDVVSVTAANDLRPPPPNPFSDNDSISEPPPPYRPRSIAPPSLSNTSRQSSVRTSAVAPVTSRTHLIGPSPFADPTEDDTISDVSGPTRARNEDGLSVVSDLSYQNEPVVNRSSL
jgi:hypothetical protein